MSQNSKKKTAISADVMAIVDQQKDYLTFNIEERRIVEKTPGELYEKTLPDGVTLEEVEKIDLHRVNFVAASAYTAGKMAVDAMKNDSTIDQVTMAVQMGKGTLADFVVDRRHEQPNHLQGGDPIVIHGRVLPRLKTKAGSGNSTMKAVRAEVARLGQESLVK